MNTEVPLNLGLAIEHKDDEQTMRSVYDLLHYLRQVAGALDYSGDCSSQVLLPLKNGGYLRIGKTDDDVGQAHTLWADRYEGLAVVGGTNLQTGEKF